MTTIVGNIRVEFSEEDVKALLLSYVNHTLHIKVDQVRIDRRTPGAVHYELWLSPQGAMPKPTARQRFKQWWESRSSLRGELA